MSCTHEGGCTCMDDPYGGSLEQAADREYVEKRRTGQPQPCMDLV